MLMNDFKKYISILFVAMSFTAIQVLAEV